MKVVATLLVFVLVSGCAAQVRVHSSPAPPPPPPHALRGTTASVGFHVHGTSVAAVILAAALLGAAVESLRREQPLRAAEPSRLAPDRTVNEQDCSRPIADPYANLKCR
jgi:hypothetical protein